MKDKKSTWYSVKQIADVDVRAFVPIFRKNGMALGFFFDCRDIPDEESLFESSYGLDRLLFVGRFVGSRISNGDWPSTKGPILACTIPLFGRVDLVNSKIGYAVSYSATLQAETETRCDVSIANRLPEDGYFGYLALEQRLRRLLEGSAERRLEGVTLG
jgi:hypothetical protein